MLQEEIDKGSNSRRREKAASTIGYGDNATTSMLIDGSGYYIDGPDNGIQYFVDMKPLNEIDKQ